MAEGHDFRGVLITEFILYREVLIDVPVDQYVIQHICQLANLILHSIHVCLYMHMKKTAGRNLLIGMSVKRWRDERPCIRFHCYYFYS